MRNKTFSIRWFTVALSLAGALALFERIAKPALLNYYQDDAFYYFQIARNIASHHGSTFDGIHLTNGYHPLWMLTLVALNIISSGKLFFILLQCVALASFITTFLAARTTFRYFSSNPVFTEMAAAAVALQGLMLFLVGMEVTLTIPLTLLLCWYRLRPQFRWKPAIATGYGLLAALVVLSRLDSAIFITVLFFLELALEPPASFRDWSLRICALVSAAVPLSLYLLSNHHWFHVWMPISGAAKQLRLHHSFTLTTLKASLTPINPPYYIFIVCPAFLVLLLGIATSLRSEKLRLRRGNLIVSLSLMLFPFLQLLAFSTTSDWPIWPWYIYSCPLAMTGGFLIYFNRSSDPEIFVRKATHPLIEGSMVLLALVFAATCTAEPPHAHWYFAGRYLEAFAQTHDGIYAMGDCAGTPAYLIHQPLVQLEGLVMDAPYLENIRERRNLNQVLKNYGVRYYVTIHAVHIGSCYDTIEPAEAGPDSPHMSGSFCQPPISSSTFDGITIDIFDLK